LPSPRFAAWPRKDTPFTGVLYCGLMMTARGPQVLEFNARFGDPETQAMLVRLESDLVDALEACVDGRWPRRTALEPGASACVVASSAAIRAATRPDCPSPDSRAAAQVPGVQVFHSGTALKDGQLLTAGGRVLGVTAAATR
jgi:phosphoribosylamine--glycine ligase